MTDLTSNDGQSAAAPSPFTPIADYAFLSDCHTGALVAPDGAIDWLCVPRFDSPSVFGALLDRQAGFFRFGPFGINHPTARAYEPGTNVLVTTWKVPSGWVVVRDALTLGPWDHEDTITPHTRPPADDDGEHTLVRTVECLEGRVEMELVCEPAFDYGREHGRVDAWSATTVTPPTPPVPGVTVRLHTDLALGIEGGRVRGRHMLEAGERAFCSLSWAEGFASPADADDAAQRIANTVRFWRSWLSRARIPDHRWRDPIQRSALTIKGLTYMPTGATVAALTTSLPETPGGERNWDYRYTWMRDTTFTLQALHWLNLDWEADEFMEFIADVEATEDGSLQIMYGIDGRRDLTETTRDDLSGYAGARPVRIGNGAFDQRQNDVYGAVLDSIHLHTQRAQRLPRRAVADRGDAGRVRARRCGAIPTRASGRRVANRSTTCRRSSCAGSRSIAPRSSPASAATTRLAAKWRAVAEEIRDDILAHGVTDAGVLRQHYETDALDASVLLAAIFGFLARDDPRLARDGHRDRERSHRERLRAPLSHRRDRRRPLGQGGHLPDLLVLARLGARDRRRSPVGP